MRRALLAILLLSSTAALAAGEDELARGDDLRLKQWQDGKALDAIPLYEEARTAGADPFEVEWRIASAYFWAGEAVKDDEKLQELGKKCIAHAEKAEELKPDAVQGPYYQAVCWGTYSHGISIPKALTQGVEGKFKRAAKRAEKIDASWEDAAPLNAWGRFYFELPWPKRDLDKSEKYLKRAITTSPCNLRSRLYYAETVLKKGGKIDGKDAEDVAKEQLQYVADHEHCPSNPGDGELAKRGAAKLLKKL